MDNMQGTDRQTHKHRHYARGRQRATKLTPQPLSVSSALHIVWPELENDNNKILTDEQSRDSSYFELNAKNVSVRERE